MRNKPHISAVTTTSELGRSASWGGDLINNVFFMSSFIWSIVSFDIVHLALTDQRDKAANLWWSVVIADHQVAQDHLATACRNQAPLGCLHANSFNTKEWRAYCPEVCHFQLHVTNQFDFGTSAFWFGGVQCYQDIISPSFLVLCKLLVHLAQFLLGCRQPLQSQSFSQQEI